MAIPGSDWQHVPGWASDVGVGANGSVFVIGGGNTIYQWDGGNGWHATSGAGLAVSVASDGRAWVVGTNGSMYRGAGAVWEDLGGVLGSMMDIGVGPTGSAWGCFYHHMLNNKGIWQWHEPSRTWNRQGGHGSRIAVGGDGTPWHIGEEGRIYRWQDNNWVQVDGRAQDIGVGPNGELWHIGDEDRIYFREGGIGGSWVQVSGAAVRISVGPNGLPWVVNREGAIFRRV